MTKFNVDDKVKFTDKNGETKVGYITSINTDEGFALYKVYRRTLDG